KLERRLVRAEACGALGDFRGISSSLRVCWRVLLARSDAERPSPRSTSALSNGPTKACGDRPVERVTRHDCAGVQSISPLKCEHSGGRGAIDCSLVCRA